MENPFLLAVALWESREVTIRLLAGERENEPDSQVAGEKPIDWRLRGLFESSPVKRLANLSGARVLTWARTLLADNRLSIAEIAQMAGFTDQSHLNRLFRRCFNLTPQEVRRMQNS